MRLALRLSGAMLAVCAVSLAQPVTTKVFEPGVVLPGGNTQIKFTIANPSAGAVLTGVAFTDTLTGGLKVGSPAFGAGSCSPGGTGVVSTPGGASINFSSGLIPAGGNCTFSINVVAPATAGVIDNTTGPVASSAGPGAPGTASLFVSVSPVIAKSFGAVSIGQGGVTTMTITITNPPGNVPITGLAFTDTLPPGLRATGVVSATCVGSVLVEADSVSLSGGTLAPGATCSITVNVTGVEFGWHTNTTSTVTSNEAPPGAAAAASVNVGDPYQVSYFPNLNLGDSFLNATNAGTMGADLQSGTTAGITGAFCLNVYAFSPDEQMVACCSCPVTPNGLRSFSAINDLISNTLTPAVPTSIVVKLLATVPVGGSCMNSAAAVAARQPANGLKAWGTKLHAGVVPGALAVTEAPFAQAVLSPGELRRLGSLCNFILANGTGYGICASCRLGALGAAKQ